MSTHSVTAAKNHLSELIDRALRGERVVITRHGRPVVELKPVAEAPRAVSIAELDWLSAHRVGKAPRNNDAAALVSRMRDEDEH
jgi:prevent-host-death family protein